MKKKKMITLLVPIFTEEYSIRVCLGTRSQILCFASDYLNQSLKAVENDYGNCRGRAWNALDDVYGRKNPIIVIDSTLPAHVALATVAHEASHAMDFIEEYVGVRDRNGEFHAHGISAVMRAVGNKLLSKFK
ncbi:MAG: hypothetical protein WC648_01175 [Candidatus Paceibacterota bacterium]|jgi:hypothetical protein